MTLLVGVLCSDGVVIGADSAFTMGVLGQQTVSQSAPKIEVVDGRALIATSGPVGLGQRLAGVFGDVLRENRIPTSLKSYKVMGVLRGAFWEPIENELKAAAVAQQVIGSVAHTSALSWTLLAMSVGGRPTLYQFDQQGAPEEATDKIPFVCLGSGQMIADPFMAFLRGIFWQADTLPTINEGLFATVWTLAQAIDVSPGGLGRPIRVFTLCQDGAACAARQVDESELQELEQAVAGARDSLRRYRMVDRDVQAPPEA
jgi:hypothetical protein